MNRAEKTEVVAQMTDRFSRAIFAVVTEYRGLNVSQMTELRRRLRGVGGEYVVSKNTLSSIALRDTPATAITDLIKGPVAVAFAYSDAVAVAKVLKDFTKEAEPLVLKGGVLDGALLGVKQVEQLATMPSRDELRAKLLALFNTPATNLVRLLKAPAQQLVQVLSARSKQDA
jgi:large subunit ribosomal protein L10